MRKTILILGAILLVANILIGTIVSWIDCFNTVASSIVIIQTIVMLLLTTVLVLKDGFKVSFLCIFTIIGVINYLLSLFAPAKIENNWWLLVVIVFMAFECILLVVANRISKTINQDEDN